MNAMIQDLIDSARLEAGQLRLDRQPVDLQPFLAKLLEHAEGMMDVGRIVTQIPQGLPPVSVLGKVEKWTALKFKSGLLGTPSAGRQQSA